MSLPRPETATGKSASCHLKKSVWWKIWHLAAAFLSSTPTALTPGARRGVKNNK